jgi:hypothetical protein
VKKEYDEEIEVLMANMAWDESRETESGASSGPSALDTPVDYDSSSCTDIGEPSILNYHNPPGELYYPPGETSSEEDEDM